MSAEPTPPSADGPMRAVDVLEGLAGMEQPASLDAVAAALNLPKSKAYRSLRSLQDQGFVDHVGRSGYRLGSRSVALAALIGPRLDLVGVARPVVVRLAELSLGTATLHLRSGAHRVLVIGAECANQPLRGAVVIGERAPLTSGCSGVAILAHLPAAEAHDVIRQRPPREQRPVSSLLAKIRQDGYALSFGDNHVGINGVAAPILGPSDGYPLGSIALAGAEARLPELALLRLSALLINACNRLAPRLARVLGPNAMNRHAALDVTIQDLLLA